MRRIVILAIFLFIIPFAKSVNIDSLKRLMTTQTGNDWAASCFEISRFYLMDSSEISKHWADSLLEYAKSTNKLEWEAKALYQISKISLYNYHFENSIALIENAIKIFERIPDYKWLVKSYILFGMIYYNQMETEKSIPKYIQALEAAKRSKGNTDLIILAWNNIAASYIRLKDYNKATEYLNKSMKLARETDNKVEIQNVLNNIAILYNSKGEYDSALKYYDQSIQLSLETESKMEFAMATALKGNVYYFKGDYKKCLDQYQEALKLFEVLGNKEFMAKYLNNIAVVYKKTGRHEQAIKYFLRSLQIKDELNDIHGIATTYNNIGTIYSERKNHDKAIEYYKNALKVINRNYTASIAAMAYNNIGTEFSSQENYDSALYYYLISLQLRDTVWEKHALVESLINIGNLYYEHYFDTLQAKSYFERAMQLSDKIGSVVLKTSVQTKVANILIREKKYSRALQLLNASLESSMKENYTELLPDIYKGLINIYEIEGNFKKALNYQKDLDALKDKLFTSNQTEIINELQTRYETEKKEKENTILRSNIKIQKRTNLVLVIGIAALILLSVLLYFLFRLKNKTLKQKTQLFKKENKVRELKNARLEDQLFAEQEINKLQTEKLEQKNRELSSRILHIINKNEAMSNIINELEKIKEKQPEDFNQCFVKVNKIVKDNITIDKDWQQFKLHFEEVNPGFFHNLQQKYPQLSQNELKLCAYYRIRLGTKEIAKMLNVTPAAIQKSRHRLRKKMDIPSETEMPEFMSRF